MKKTLVGIGMALIAVISLSSCKKDYACNCVLTIETEAWIVNGVELQSASTSSASSSRIIHDNKEDATADCALGSSVTSDNDTPSSTMTNVCTIAE